MDRLHVQVRYVPSRGQYHWEVGHQDQGAIAFDLSPPDCNKVIAYLRQALRTKPETCNEHDQFLMTVVFLPEDAVFRWKIGFPNEDLSIELDSANFARVLEYLETVLESANRFLQQQN